MGWGREDDCYCPVIVIAIGDIAKFLVCGVWVSSIAAYRVRRHLVRDVDVVPLCSECPPRVCSGSDVLAPGTQLITLLDLTKGTVARSIPL